jgi:HSP20 family molecular chaperone IbpA
VNEIQDELKQVSHDGETQMNNLKENYERQALAEDSRQETLLASEKNKGYENLRDLQRTQAAELARVKREGENELSRLTNYYRDATSRAEQSGTEMLRDTTNRNQRQLEYETHTGSAAADEIRQEQQADLQRIQAERDFRVGTLEKQARETYEKKRAETSEAIEKSNSRLETDYKQVSEQHQQTMARLNNATYSELQKTRLDHARKLAAYDQRADDPFYQLLDLQADFEDEGDKYVLTARIPEHEQKNISVAVRGNQIVLSGTRRNEEKVELSPGHLRGTNSYQSFMESFPLAQPVDVYRVTHEFKGDRVMVTIPKKAMASEYKPHRPTPHRIAVQKPNFPPNLPHVGDDDATKVAQTEPASGGSETLVKE